MDKLSRETHELFTDDILKILVQNKISTLLDFLREDICKLATLTKLSLPQVITVRCETLAKFSAPAKRGDELYKNRRNNSYISTGIDRLDCIVSGGLPVGRITEICGLAGAGKSQICFSLAVRAAMDFDKTVLYIDTKGDFSAIAIQKYLENNGYSHEEMAGTMSRIKVVRVWTMHELIELLHQLKSKRLQLVNLRMILIDSLSCLMFQFLGEESKIGLTLLNKFVNVARFLCKELDLVMICVNILTRWVEQAVQDIDDDEAGLITGVKEWVEKKHRCLGRYWQHIPALVLQLDISQNNSMNSNSVIDVDVVKSVVGECGCRCNLNLSNKGII